MISAGISDEILSARVAALTTAAAVDRQEVRIGVDVVDISRFERQLRSRGGQAMIATRFTDHERHYCERRPDRLAARWAAKEAVAKAIGTGFRGLRPSDIEIIHHLNGQPAVSVPVGVTWPNDAHRWYWSVSLCHEGDRAVAVAVAVIPII
ncbi:MAG: synthase [Rhodococcus erythropolis]|jgi:holo-[acyl-carrier protein] synthase|nr:synthase [Rhodococcus erythropolis]